MASDGQFQYSAVDPSGRRVRGALAARDEAEAFEALRSQGLSPLRLRRGRPKRESADPKVRLPPERESAEFLGSLADLLRAGADVRTALGILGARSDRSPVKQLANRLTADISGGDPLDRAFARSFQGRQAFVASMVAAGEAAGDLPAGLQRAAEVFTSRLKLQDQLVSVLAYPTFVLLSAVAAVFAILLFIVPSIAPLAAEAGAQPPVSLAVLIAASDFLRANLLQLAVVAVAVIAAMTVALASGLIAGPVERLILDGPLRRTVRALVFGAFSMSLGAMLASGAPATDALRLAARSVRSRGAQRRLAPLVQKVREGQTLSTALEAVPGFPPAIVRLAVVGEATNALGPMLVRGGQLEEDAAMRRIEAIGRIAGPALIVFLGILLGVLMGGLLTGVSSMGQSALE